MAKYKKRVNKPGGGRPNVLGETVIVYAKIPISAAAEIKKRGETASEAVRKALFSAGYGK